MELSRNDFNKINELSIKEKGDNEYLLLKLNKNINRSSVEKLLMRYILPIDKGGWGSSYDMKQYLEINENVLIEDKENIKYYWLNNDLKTINAKKKVRKITSPITIDDYDIEGGYIREEETKLDGSITPKKYRYISSYIINIDSGVEILVNEVKEEETLNKFQETNILSKVNKYFIEIKIKDTYDDWDNVLITLLQTIDNSYFIISNTEKNIVIKSFKKLLTDIQIPEATPFTKKDSKKVEKNFGCTTIENGNKAFLFIPKHNTEEIDRQCYLIFSDNRVVKVGRISTGGENTILQVIVDDLIIHLYDILVNQGVDVRNEPLNISKKGRLPDLIDYYRNYLQLSKLTDEEYKDIIPEFNIVRYLFGDDITFYTNCSKLLNEYKMKKNKGLLFINSKGDYNSERYKWNYPDKNTIELVVEILKENGQDIINPFVIKDAYFSDEIGKMIQYKTLKLFVQKEGKLYPFHPTGVENKSILMANIPLNNSGKIMTQEDKPEEITDKMVVEFLFMPIYEEYTDLCNWTPINVNWEKTNLLRNGILHNIINEKTADLYWYNFSNPIDEDALRSGNLGVIENKNFYLLNRPTNRTQLLPYNQAIKNSFINVYNKIDENNKLLEIGEQVDFMYWIKFRDVVSISFDKSLHSNAIKNYINYKNQKPQISFILGIPCETIYPQYKIAKDTQSKTKCKKEFMSRFSFDNIISLEGANIFFKNELCIRMYLLNIIENLKIGGFYTVMLMDGLKIYESLKGMKKPLEGFRNETLIWKIQKQYSIKKFDSNIRSLGHQFELYESSKGVPSFQYLCNIKYFEELCMEYGLKLVEKSSIKGDNLSDGEKDLLKYYIIMKFERFKELPDKLYKKVADLTSKMKGGGIIRVRISR